jgi:hypothetical protein
MSTPSLKTTLACAGAIEAAGALIVDELLLFAGVAAVVVPAHPLSAIITDAPAISAKDFFMKFPNPPRLLRKLIPKACYASKLLLPNYNGTSQMRNALIAATACC